MENINDLIVRGFQLNSAMVVSQNGCHIEILFNAWLKTKYGAEIKFDFIADIHDKSIKDIDKQFLFKAKDKFDFSLCDIDELEHYLEDSIAA